MTGVVVASILKVQLDDLITVDGIRTAVIVGHDGFVIEGVSRDAHADTDAVGAVISSTIQSSMRAGTDLGIGFLKQGLMEFSEGILVTAALGDLALLCLLCDLKANLGAVRLEVRRRAPELVASL